MLLAAPEVSGLLILLSPQAMTDPTGVAQALAPEIKKQAKPVFAVWMGAQDVAAGIGMLNEAGIPTFRDPRGSGGYLHGDVLLHPEPGTAPGNAPPAAR